MLAYIHVAVLHLTPEDANIPRAEGTIPTSLSYFSSQLALCLYRSGIQRFKLDSFFGDQLFICRLTMLCCLHSVGLKFGVVSCEDYWAHLHPLWASYERSLLKWGKTSVTFIDVRIVVIHEYIMFSFFYLRIHSLKMLYNTICCSAFLLGIKLVCQSACPVNSIQF